MFDGVIDRQEFRELERRAYGGDAAAGGRCSSDVVQQVVQQVDRRVLAITPLAEFIERLDLPVRLAEQTLQRCTTLEAIGAHRLENRTRNPPQLKYGLRGGHLLELFGYLRQNFQILHGTFAADVSQ